MVRKAVWSRHHEHPFFLCCVHVHRVRAGPAVIRRRLLVGCVVRGVLIDGVVVDLVKIAGRVGVHDGDVSGLAILGTQSCGADGCQDEIWYEFWERL